MHKAKYGRAFNESGSAALRRQATHRTGASEWNCCRLLCGLLFRLFYLVFVNLSLCSVIYLIFVHFYAYIFFRPVRLLDIYVQEGLLDMYVRSMLYASTSKELSIYFL